MDLRVFISKRGNSLQKKITSFTRRLGFEVVRAYPNFGQQRIFDLPQGDMLLDPQRSKFWLSFGLYGRDPLYSEGILAACDSYKKFFPGWLPIVFVGDSVDSQIIEALVNDYDAQIVHMFNQSEDASASLWRYLAVDLVKGSAIVFRDADSRATLRERAAVDEWLASGRKAHLMRDNKNHTVAVMGGMWGLRLPFPLSFKNLIVNYGPDNQFGADQRFLRSVVYPVVTKSCLVHSDLLLFQDAKEVELSPFPFRAESGEYVGRGFHPNGQPRDGH